MKTTQPPQQTTPADANNGARRTLYQRAYMLPMSVGVCFLLVMTLISVPLGNWRELDHKLKEAGRVWDGLEIDGKKIPADQQVPIGKIIEGCSASTANLLSIMAHYPDAAKPERAALESARTDLRAAKDPPSTAKANQTLEASMTKAMQTLYNATQISTEDDTLVRQVVDSYNEQARKLKLRARDYNRQMQKAIDTYDGLPTRSLFAKPQLYDLE